MRELDDDVAAEKKDDDLNKVNVTLFCSFHFRFCGFCRRLPNHVFFFRFARV